MQVEHLSAEQKLQLTKFMFALNSQELGRTSSVKHVINTRDHPLVRQPMYMSYSICS